MRSGPNHALHLKSQKLILRQGAVSTLAKRQLHYFRGLSRQIEGFPGHCWGHLAGLVSCFDAAPPPEEHHRALDIGLL